mgnify:CR=1 FL=1
MGYAIDHFLWVLQQELMTVRYCGEKNEINFYQTVKEGKCEDDVFVKTGCVNIKVTDEFKRGQKQTMRSILSTRLSRIDKVHLTANVKFYFNYLKTISFPT